MELNLWLTKLEEIIKKFGEMVINHQEPEVFIFASVAVYVIGIVTVMVSPKRVNIFL
ncbi:MAG UNVERIFIED_CONTAM: hypothetical protein LVR29_31680 [Microcystis novacekii LVE1205-3]